MMNATPITSEILSQLDTEYQKNHHQKAMTNVLSQSELAKVSFSNQKAARLVHKFSLNINTMTVTAQKASGRCWLFAALNLLREKIAKEKNIESFELSQSYLAFWDKFERSNYFLESIIDTAEREIDDRTVSYILQTGVFDGGQWDMFVNIVDKYGVVPKDAMPETHQSSNTNPMNQILNEKLREDACILRKMAGASTEKITGQKNLMLKEIYLFLCTCYGEPPKSFDFEYVNKDKEYKIETGYTPKSFCEKYVGSMLEDYVSIIHAPTKDKPYHKTFTVEYLGNVVGGKPVKYLNMTMDEMKELVLAQLMDNELVWFGSDVSSYGNRDLGTWDDQSYDYQAVTGLHLGMTKEERLDTRQSAMNHAMVITGVNMRDGHPERFKIENSWGDEKGDKGYFIISDSWFDEYVFQAVIHKKYLKDRITLWEQEPIQLKPWDPMGSLAK